MFGGTGVSDCVPSVMNKPVALICAFMVGLGVLVLCSSIYFCVVYGQGDLEAGNFHRCQYSTEHDPETGATRRDWETRWDLVSSTEGSPLSGVLNMWALGLGLVVLGSGIHIVEGTRRRGQPGF